MYQVLCFLETQLKFAMLLHRLSLADATGWPFLCVSIGFTKVQGLSSNAYCDCLAHCQSWSCGLFFHAVAELSNYGEQEALGVLRRGSCYSECNRRKTVLGIINELHQAQFYAFWELCRREPATHHALHLAKVIIS